MQKPMHGVSLEERFWARVDKKSADECWPWTGFIDPGGYGTFWKEGKIRRAHRVGYEIQVGAIPEGLHLDHLCRVRHCVNAAHLEPVTKAENTRRGLLPARRGASNRAKTHCPKGHEYTERNTRVRNHPNGWVTRECKECHRIRERNRSEARSASRNPLPPAEADVDYPGG